jgi:ankyrin repeat protein
MSKFKAEDVVVNSLSDIPNAISVVREMLRYGIDENWSYYTGEGGLLLDLAIKNGGLISAVVLSAFLEYGVKSDWFHGMNVEDFFEILDRLGDSADVAKNLLCLGFDVTGTGINGWNAFCYAVYRRKIKCIPYLAMAGADPNFRVECDERDTPLEAAVYKDDPDMILALVAVGASLELRNPITKMRPLEMATSLGHVECAEVIQTCEDAISGRQ